MATDNEKAEADRLKKVAALKAIKCNIPKFKSTVNDGTVDSTIYIPNVATGGGFPTRGGAKVKLSKLTEQTALYLKLYPSLQSKTTATDEQMELIKATSVNEIKALYA